MGSASLVATAIALVLLIITAYVIVGGTLATAQVVALAQSEQAQNQESRMRTAISIIDANLSNGGSPLYVRVQNTGSESIVDIEHVDIYLIFDGDPVYFPPGSAADTWQLVGIAPDTIHPGQVDPDEVMNISVSYSAITAPVWVQITTANGVSDSRYI